MTARRMAAALVALLVLVGCGATHRTDSTSAAPRVDHTVHDSLPADVRTRGSLTIAIDPSYAPMESYAADGHTIVGMEPDLARALGAVLGVKVKLRDTSFASILTGVAADRFDVGLSAITDTADRARTVDFVDYFTSGTAIVVQRGNPQRISSLPDLCGHVVAAERGTVQADLLLRTRKQCPAGMTVQQFTTNSDALLRLRTGRAAAVLNDMPPAAELSTGRTTRAFYQLASSRQYEPGYFGMAISQDRPALRDAVVGALQVLQRDGRYDAVLRHWRLQNGAVTRPLVNSGR